MSRLELRARATSLIHVLRVDSEKNGSYSWSSYRHDSRNTGFNEGPAPDTNQTVWISDVGDDYSYGFGQPYNVGPVVAYGKVFINDHKNRLWVWDETDGTLLWTDNAGAFRAGPAASYGMVYLGTRGGTLLALNISTGSFVWEYQIYGYYSPLFSPQVADGRVFYNNRDGWLFCLNASTGDFLWKYETGLGENAYVAVADGRVFTLNGCLNETDGTMLWQFTDGGGSVGAPVVDDGRVFLNWGSISCLDEFNGSLMWKYETEGNVGGLAVAYGKVFASIGGLVCLNAEDGQFKWSNGPAAGYPYGSPSVADGKVFVTDMNRLSCFDVNNGSLIWHYYTPDDGFLGRLTTPVIADGMVFVAAKNYIYAFGGAPSSAFPTWALILIISIVLIVGTFIAAVTIYKRKQ